MINTLRSSDENEVRLAERLNNLYDSAMSDDKVLDMAMVQKEVHDFWKTIRSNQEMTFNSQKKKNITRKNNRKASPVDEIKSGKLEIKTCSGNQGSHDDGKKENRKRKRKSKGEKKET